MTPALLGLTVVAVTLAAIATVGVGEAEAGGACAGRRSQGDLLTGTKSQI